MVNTRKKSVHGKTPESGESSAIASSGQPVQLGQPDNGKQSKIPRKKAVGAKGVIPRLKSRSPGQKKVNQQLKKNRQGKKENLEKSKAGSSGDAEVQFREDGRTINMGVTSNLPPELIEQFAEPSDQSENNNATKFVPDQEKIANEILDYQDDIPGLTDNSSDSDSERSSESEESGEDSDSGSDSGGEDLRNPSEESSSDEDGRFIAKRAAEYLAVIKEEKRLKRNKAIRDKKEKKGVDKDKAQAWQLVEQFCNQEGYQIVRPKITSKSSRDNQDKAGREVVRGAPPKAKATTQTIRPNQSDRSPESRKRKRGKSSCCSEHYPDKSMSEVTLYQRAIPSVVDYVDDNASSNKRFNIKSSDYENLRERVDRIQISSSSGDFVNTSDEIDNAVANELSERFITDCQMNDKLDMPSTSKVSRFEPDLPAGIDQRRDELAKAKLRETEAAKEATYQVPGELRKWGIGPEFNFDLSRDYVHSAMVDEDYLLVSAHVDESTQRKIANQEFIDFSKLIPRDRILVEEESCLELVNKGGRTFLVPATASTDATAITNFSRWEQSFRVFATIYTNYFPNRASELLQYNHLIHTASLSFSWENVYAYDKDFRIHMSRYPNRSWGIILQQAWSVRLKDKINHNNGKNSGGSGSGLSGRPRKDICYRFNSGKCSYGQNCKFEHRCLICNKYGHGAWNCRRGSGHNHHNDDKERDRRDFGGGGSHKKRREEGPGAKA